MADVIREYDSRQELQGVNPGDPAKYFAEAGSFAKQTWDSIGRSVGGGITDIQNEQAKAQKQADDAAYQKEVVNGALSEAKLEQSLNEQWSQVQRSTDPNNWDQARTQFLENTAQPAFNEYLDSYQTDRGKVHGAESVARMEQSWYHNTLSDTANGAAIGTENDLTQYVNTQSENLHAHPENIDNYLGAWDSKVAAIVSTSNVDPKEAQKIAFDVHQQGTTQLVNAALNGNIDQDPVKFYSDAEQGKYDKYAPFLGSDGILAAKKRAVEEFNLRKDAAKTADVQLSKQQDDAINQATTELMTKQFDDHGNFQLTPDYYTGLKQIAGMPGFKAGSVDSGLKFGQMVTAGQGAKVNDHATRARLQGKLVDGSLTQTDIWDAALSGKLKPGEDGVGLFTGALKARTEGTIPTENSAVGAMFKTALQLHTPHNSDSGFPTQADYALDTEYNQWFLPNYMNGLKQNKTPEQMLNPVGPGGKPNPDYLPDHFDPKQSDITKQPLMFPAGVVAPPSAGPQPAGGGKTLPPITDEIFNNAGVK